MNNVKPDIRFSDKGIIEISSKIATILGLENGDIAGFKQSDEELYIYLFSKASNRNYKGRCIQAKKTGKFMRIYWKDLCNKIIELDGKSKDAAYRVGDPVRKEGKIFLPIITRINYETSRD